MSSEHLDLADYRRRVAGLYLRVHESDLPPDERLHAFRSEKDELLRTHPQSPIPRDRRAAFGGLSYWPYDPELRFSAALEPEGVEGPGGVPLSGGGEMGLRRIGSVAFRLAAEAHRLGVYWFTDYAGGVFIPFRDATNGTETYGGGRYLWDSAKGADLGSAGDELVLDFNYAYHPSCVFDSRWICPLAPVANRISAPIRAGERLVGVTRTD